MEDESPAHSAGIPEEVWVCTVDCRFSFAALLQFYRGDLIMEGKIRAYREGTPYYVCDSEDILGFFLKIVRRVWKIMRIRLQKAPGYGGRDLSLIPGFCRWW